MQENISFPKKHVYFSSLPMDAIFVHKGDTYRKIGEESALDLFTEEEACFEIHWGCIISKQQYDKYELTKADERT